VDLHRGVGIGIGDANYLGGAQKLTGFTNRAEEQQGGEEGTPAATAMATSNPKKGKGPSLLTERGKGKRRERWCIPARSGARSSGDGV
jgi:hypothetical protein